MGFVVCLIGSWITSAKLIFKLREGFPDIYAKIGSPSACSRSANFLWDLKPHESALDPDLRRLRVKSLIFLRLFIGLGLAFVGIIIATAFLDH